MIRKLESKPFLFFFRDHLRSTLGIICGPFWGSFAVLYRAMHRLGRGANLLSPLLSLWQCAMLTMFSLWQTLVISVAIMTAIHCRTLLWEEPLEASLLEFQTQNPLRDFRILSLIIKWGMTYLFKNLDAATISRSKYFRKSKNFELSFVQGQES